MPCETFHPELSPSVCAGVLGEPLAPHGSWLVRRMGSFQRGFTSRWRLPPVARRANCSFNAFTLAR
jgi:hypothetical protein